MNVIWIYLIMLLGIVSFIALIFILIIFGKIIRVQFKYWTLKSKGYIKIEHYGEDKIIRTYFLKPSEDKFDFEGGFFAFQKDALFHSEEMFAKVNKELLNKKPESELTAEEKEYKRLLNSVGKFKFDSEAIALNWGIPTLLYYGQDINPIKPSERKKIYDGKIFKALYMRLLLLKEWKFIRFAFIVIMVAVIIGSLFSIIGMVYMSKVQKTNSQCFYLLNDTQTKYNELLNRTVIPAFNQRVNNANNYILNASEGTVRVIS